jgi:drug/metabolite transporter (DMT)-like permease
LLFFAQPIVGASLGAIFLGEALDRGFWIGGVLISAGLLLAAREQQLQSKSAIT